MAQSRFSLYLFLCILLLLKIIRIFMSLFSLCWDLYYINQFYYNFVGGISLHIMNVKLLVHTFTPYLINLIQSKIILKTIKLFHPLIPLSVIRFFSFFRSLKLTTFLEADKAKFNLNTSWKKTIYKNIMNNPFPQITHPSIPS